MIDYTYTQLSPDELAELRQREADEARAKREAMRKKMRDVRLKFGADDYFGRGMDIKRLELPVLDLREHQ